MQNLEFVLEYEMHKIFWDFEIPADHRILTRQPDLMIANKKKKKEKKKKRIYRIVDFAARADNRVKLREREKRDKYLDLARKLKKYRT